MEGKLHRGGPRGIDAGLVAEKNEFRVQFEGVRAVEVDPLGWLGQLAGWGQRHVQAVHLAVARGRWGRGNRVHRGQRGGRGRPVLLLELASPLSFLPLDPLTFCRREHLLVLDPELTATDLPAIQQVHHQSRLVGRVEVGEGQPPEHPVVEVVVERVGERQVALGHEVQELLFLDREGDVLDHHSCGNDLVISGSNVVMPAEWLC